MTNTLSKILKSLADNVIYAETTLSEYYKIGCIKVRFSDHIANDMDCDLAIFCNTIHKQNVYVIIPMVGTFKEVQWFSNVTDVVDFITRFESMARIMLKNPTPSNNKSKRRASNVTTKQIEASKKISYTEWCGQLSCMYNSKKINFNTVLDNIYKLSPTNETFTAIKKLSSVPQTKRYNMLLDILKKF